MTERLVLRKQLGRAWDKTIEQAYNNCLINSERGLQFYFCHFLLEEFDNPEFHGPRRLFIEPSLKLGKPPVLRMPDILICNQNQVIGAIEIKYAPRGVPAFKKDLETLEILSRSGDQVTISNERYLGPSKVKSYSVASDAVMCWAAIHGAKASVPLPSQIFSLQVCTKT